MWLDANIKWDTFHVSVVFVHASTCFYCLPRESTYMHTEKWRCCVYKFLLHDTCTPNLGTYRWVFVEIMLKLQCSFVLSHLHHSLDFGMFCMQLWFVWQLGTSDSLISGSSVGISVVWGFWPCSYSMTHNYFSSRSESEFLTKRVKITNTTSLPAERRALKGQSSIWWAHICIGFVRPSRIFQSPSSV